MRVELNPKVDETEQALLSALLSGDDSILAGLRQQLAVAVPVKRELSGVGVFLTFSLPSDVQLVEPPNLTIDDVVFDLRDREHGGGAILFVRDGRLNMLEAYLDAEEWPETAQLTGIRYDTGDQRNLAILGKVWREPRSKIAP